MKPDIDLRKLWCLKEGPNAGEIHEMARRNDLEQVVREFCSRSGPAVWSDQLTGQIHCDLDFETPVLDHEPEDGCHLCGQSVDSGGRQGLVVFDDARLRPLIYYPEDIKELDQATTDDWELICSRCIDWSDALDHYQRVGSKIPYSFAVGDVVSLADGSCRYEILKRGHTGILEAKIIWPYYTARCLDPIAKYVRQLSECQLTKDMAESPARLTRMLTPLVAPTPARTLPTLDEVTRPALGGPTRTVTGLPRLDDLARPALAAPRRPSGTGLPTLDDVLGTRLLPGWRK